MGRLGEPPLAFQAGTVASLRRIDPLYRLEINHTPPEDIDVLPEQEGSETPNSETHATRTNRSLTYSSIHVC